MKSRLMGDGLFRPHLRLTDTEQIFFFLLIDFNFPTIEIGLKDLNHIGGRIADQQVSGLTIETMPVSVIGQRRDNDQTQGAPLGATAPENTVASIWSMSRSSPAMTGAYPSTT